MEFRRIVDCLERTNIRPLILICDSFSKNSFFKLRKYKPLVYGFITPEIIQESKRLSKELHKKWADLSGETKTELFRHEGQDYWNFFRKNFDFLFSKEILFTLIKYYFTFKRVLETYNIKVVYMVRDGMFEFSGVRP